MFCELHRKYFGFSFVGSNFGGRVVASIFSGVGIYFSFIFFFTFYVFANEYIYMFSKIYQLVHSINLAYIHTYKSQESYRPNSLLIFKTFLKNFSYRIKPIKLSEKRKPDAKT